MGIETRPFFHTKASHRHARNWVSKIKNEDGALVYEEEQIAEVMVNYLHKLFEAGELTYIERQRRGKTRKGIRRKQRE